MCNTATLAAAGADLVGRKGVHPNPSPENYIVYLRWNSVCASIYYILNPLDIAQKRSLVIKGVQNLCEVNGSITIGDILF